MRIFLFFSLFIFCVLHHHARCESTIQASSVFPPSNREERTEQKKFFQENGYLWIKDFFSKEQSILLQNWANEINDAACRILTLMHSTGKSMDFFTQMPGVLIVVPEAKDPLQACRAEDLLTCYPNLHHFILGTVTSYVNYIMGDQYVLFKDKINFKWPGGGAFLPHQDFPAYEPFGPKEHVTAMISIDPATLENGCLYVAQNWRDAFANDPDINSEELKLGRAVLPYVEGGNAHGSIRTKYSEKITWLALETSPRDLVLINSFVPHYSESNKSTNSRRALFITHNQMNEGYYREAYYHAKRFDPYNPVFHFATPTHARNKN